MAKFNQIKMTNKTTILSLLFAFLISCSQNTNEKDVSLINNSEQENTDLEVEQTSNNCHCFNGIGSSKDSEPELVVNFSNGKSVSICGYYNKEMQDEGMIMSEFNVFDCETGSSFCEYGAVQTFRIINRKDSIILEELKYLPVGKNWEWKLIQIGEQVITLNNDKIKTSTIKPKLERIVIDNKQQIEFLNSLKKGTGFGENWEEDLGRLEVLSLIGNTKALKTLKKYEDFTGQLTDGAVAEQWKDAVATVEWIKEK